MTEEKQRRIKGITIMFGGCFVLEIVSCLVCMYRRMDIRFFLISLCMTGVFLMLIWMIDKYQFSAKQFKVLVTSSLIFVIVVWFASLAAFADVLRKHVIYDYQYLYGSAFYVNDILMGWNYDEADEASKETYGELCEGVIVTDWDEPQSELQNKIAQTWRVNSFRQYRNHFYSSVGPAKVYLKIVDNRAEMRLLNPTFWVGFLPETEGTYLEVKDSDFDKEMSHE